MDKTQREIDQQRQERGKFELDSVQEHFRTSNEPLIDGVPMSKVFAQKSLIFFEGQNYKLSLCPNCLTSEAKYIGFQKGISFNLNLFNCLGCKTTRSIKAA